MAPTDERIDEILRSLFAMDRWGPGLRRHIVRIETENAYTEHAFNCHLAGSGRSCSWETLVEQELPDLEVVAQAMATLRLTAVTETVKLMKMAHNKLSKIQSITPAKRTLSIPTTPHPRLEARDPGQPAARAAY